MSVEFKQGVKDSIPIALGYFSVSITFGIMAAQEGIEPWLAALISVSNVTSAGQFAGLATIAAHAPLFEMFLTQLIINLRYMLMSLSLSQKLKPGVRTGKRMLIAYANTDEIFAVAMNRDRDVTPIYMAGLEIPSILGWTTGTFIGATVTGFLPVAIQSALGIALYGMFVAIVIPPAKKKHSVAAVAFIALLVSCIIYYLPVLKSISTGTSVIICTLVAAGLGAVLFPVEEKCAESDEEQITYHVGEGGDTV